MLSVLVKYQLRMIRSMQSGIQSREATLVARVKNWIPTTILYVSELFDMRVFKSKPWTTFFFRSPHWWYQPLRVRRMWQQDFLFIHILINASSNASQDPDRPSWCGTTWTSAHNTTQGVFLNLLICIHTKRKNSLTNVRPRPEGEQTCMTVSN